jgi:uncharacterized membrane protein
MVIILGVICLIVGFIFKFFPPKKINSIFGYKTILSMKNQDTWKEALKYSGNTLIILGFIFVPLQFVLSQLIESMNNGYEYEKIIILICCVVMVIINEVHLNKVFNKDGSRKV